MVSAFTFFCLYKREFGEEWEEMTDIEKDKVISCLQCIHQLNIPLQPAAFRSFAEASIPRQRRVSAPVMETCLMTTQLCPDLLDTSLMWQEIDTVLDSVLS